MTSRLCAVLDVETAPDPEAMLCAPSRRPEDTAGAALSGIRQAVVLTFADGAGGVPTDLAFVRLGGADLREQELVTGIDRALPEAAGSNRLITFNGRSWDIPILMQRAASTWCFSLRRLAAWNEIGPDRHVDMMRRGGPRAGRGWAPLGDRAAGIGIDMRLARGKAERSPAAVRRRCSADVAATFLLYAADEAVRRCDARFLGGAWIALAELVASDAALMRDLSYFAGHPLLDGCRSLLDPSAPYRARVPA